MEDKFCIVCGYKTFSKSKGRKVMCECQWNKMEEKLNGEKNNKA